MWNSDLKKYLGRGTFYDLVFRLVFFHRSLNTFKGQMNPSQLTDEEKFFFFDPKLFRFMYVMCISVAGSTRFITDPGQFQLEINDFRCRQYAELQNWKYTFTQSMKESAKNPLKIVKDPKLDSLNFYEPSNIDYIKKCKELDFSDLSKLKDNQAKSSSMCPDEKSDKEFEIEATCKRARKGLFDAT